MVKQIVDCPCIQGWPRRTTRVSLGSCLWVSHYVYARGRGASRIGARLPRRGESATRLC